MPDFTGWIETCLESAVLAFAFIVNYEGARRLVAHGFSRWSAVMLLVGILVPGYEGHASLKFSANVQVLSHVPASMQVAEPQGGWEKAASSPADRTALSTNAAQINFRLTGRRDPVIDASGQRVPFMPSGNDLRDRENLLTGQKGAEDAGAQFLERGVRLLTDVVSFMAIGAIVGGFQRSRKKKPVF